MINRKNRPLRVAHNLDRLEQALIGCTDVSVEEFRARVNNVLGFGDVYWEYGPDFEGKKMAFSVSLENGDEVIASLSRKFGFSTSSKETNFRIGIPPRRWEGDFILIGETGERIEVSASTWLFSFSGSNFLSVFLNESVRTVYEECAIRVFMVGELGEQNFGRITVSPVALMDPRKTYFGKSLLREKFANLFPECEYRSEFLK